MTLGLECKKRSVPDTLLSKSGFVLNIVISFSRLNFFWHYKLLGSSRFTLSLLDLLLILKSTSWDPQRELAHTLDPLRCVMILPLCCISYQWVCLQSKFWLFSIFSWSTGLSNVIFLMPLDCSHFAAILQNRLFKKKGRGEEGGKSSLFSVPAANLKIDQIVWCFSGK